METRFAGSERLGERRRRRLAVEADDVSPAPDEIVELSAVASPRRVVHGNAADGDVSPDSPLPALPLARLIPRAWWKYLLAGLTGLALIAGIMAAGSYAPAWSATTGVRFDRLFSTGSSPATDWFAGLLLSTAAQLALVIWWGRSRSLKDFDGRYRVWTWAAAAWLVLSCCAATGAHRLLGDLAVAHLPGRVPHRAICGWLLPALVVAGRLLPALRREMSGCRASRWLLYAAGTFYVSAVAFEFDLFEATLAGRLRGVAQQSALLAGHLGLMLSMWAHARHVLYATADPGPVSSRLLRVPRPHFRLPGLRFRSRAAIAEAPVEAKTRKSRRKSASSESAAIEEPESAPVAAVKTPMEALEPATHGAARHQAEHEQPDDRAANGDEPHWQGGPHKGSAQADEDGGEEAVDSFEKPNLKGLSKKQRRRLMQEQRDRERANRQS